MKKMYKLYSLILISLFYSCFASLNAATITSVKTGNWNVGATWVGGAVPLSTDDVIIDNTHIVTLDQTQGCKSLTISTGGTLSMVDGYDLSTTASIIVNGTLTMGNGTLTVGDGTSDYFTVSGGTLNFSGGLINVAGRYKQFSSGNAYLSGSGIFNISTAGVQSNANINSFSVTTDGVFSVSSISTVQIILKYGNSGAAPELYYSPTTSNFDGGSLIIENGSNLSDIYLKSDMSIYKIESKVGSGKVLHIQNLSTISDGFTCNSFTITSGIVQIDPNSGITVNGTLSNVNGAANLIIKSDVDGSGSLIGGGGVSATIKRYLTNYAANDDNKYHFISSPVTAQAIRPNFVANSPLSTVDFYSYDEPSNEWINTKEAVTGNWNSGFEPNFEVGKGYLVAYPSAIIKEFIGTLNSYTSTSPLVLNCTNTSGNGWNLLGNPFSSALDWGLVTTGDLGDGMDNALYYYDSDIANYKYYIQLSGETGAVGGGSQYIPAGQGFMVHAKTTGTKTVTLYEDQQTHSSQAFYKNTNNLNDLLILKINRDDFEDETTLLYYPEATNEFDGKYDAYKLYSYSTQMPQIYSINNGINLAINSLKSVDESPNVNIGYKTQVAGTFEISASGINSFTSSGDIVLEDALLNTMHDLNSNQSYVFGSEVGTFDNRFILHFDPTGIDDENIVNGQIQLWSSNNTIHLINNKNLQGNINIVNLFGQTVASYELTGDVKQQILTTPSAGMYIVNVRTDNGYVTSKKIVIK